MYSDSCVSRAEGDSLKAEQLFDCSYWQYYWRVLEYNRHCERVKEQMEKIKKK